MPTPEHLDAFRILFSANGTPKDRAEWQPIIKDQDQAFVAASYPVLEPDEIIRITQEYGQIIAELADSATFILAVSLNISPLEAARATKALLPIMAMEELRKQFARKEVNRYIVMVGEQANMAMMGAQLLNGIGIKVHKFVGPARVVETVDWLYRNFSRSKNPALIDLADSFIDQSSAAST